MPIAIRQLGLTDTLLVTELLDVIEPGWRDALSPGASGSLAFSADTHTFMFGAYVDNEPAGWVWGSHTRRPNGTIRTYVEELDVLERYRRQGIATLLVEAAIGEARRAGSAKLWLITRPSNAAGIGLYESLGGALDTEQWKRYQWHLE